MSYVDEGGVDLLTKEDDLCSHLVTKLRIKVGERFVHKEYLGVTYHCTADSNSLTLTAGKRSGLSGQVLGNTKNLSGLGNLLIYLILGNLLETKAEGHILKNAEVRIKRVVLEYHRNVTVTGLEVVYNNAIDLDGTAGDVLKTCDHTKCGGLTASRRTYEYDKFLVGNVEVKVVNRESILAVYFLYVS